MNKDLWTHLSYAAFGFVLALFFGLLRYAQDFTKEPRPAFVWWVWLIKGLTAGAVGFLASMIALEMAWPLPYAGIFIALAGWAGVEAIDAGKEAALEAIRRFVSKGAQEGDNDKR